MTISEVVVPDWSADPRAKAAYAMSYQHQQSQAAVRAATVAAVLEAWATVNSEKLVLSWFGGLLDRIFTLISMGQEIVARQAVHFVRTTLSVQGFDVDIPDLNPLSFAGIASDGRDLETLVTGAVARSFERLNRGDSPAAAVQAGANYLVLVTGTQISDAGRAADQVAITAAMPAAPAVEPTSPLGVTPPSRKKLQYGWVRMLTPPSCSRCAILAGQFYKWNDGFLRHPLCDCRHIPATEDLTDALTTDAKAYFNSLTEAQQNYFFGAANSQAIRDGADIYQVVNATTRKGAMFTADNGRRYTREGTTRRGFANARISRSGLKGKVLRPTPWQIYRDAQGDRAEAVRLLRKFGYIL